MRPHTSFILCLFLLCASIAFAQAPVLTASGDQAYCPLSKIPVVTAFNIQNPGSSPINTVYIQVSEGYDAQHDRLSLTGNHPNLSQIWNQTTGKLKLSLSPGGGLRDIIDAVYDVYFENNDSNFGGKRTFSITTGQANYLSSTGHYYEYVEDLGISWEEARIAAEGRTYYGLQGYLATLTTPEEAKLCGEQASGAGWVGGTDEATEGVWKWVTGPEGLNGGLIFWYGDASGYTPNYANWNYNQPDNAHGGPGEDYVHITDPAVGVRGAWNDLRMAGDPIDVWEYYPKGYIVEYGGMPGDPDINISASTHIYLPTINQTTAGYTCGPGQVTLTAMAEKGVVYWFDTSSGGSPIHQGTNYKPMISSTTHFYVSTGANGCYKGQRKQVTATYYEPVTVPENVTLINCTTGDPSETTSTFDLKEAIPLIGPESEYRFNFYATRSEAVANSNELTNSTVSNASSNTFYVRVNNGSPCYEIVGINLQVSSSSLPEGFMHILSTCDDDGEPDGKHVFNLTAARAPLLNALPADQDFTFSFYRTAGDALTKTNPITNEENYANETPGSQKIFVRIENKSTRTCYSVGPYVELEVNDVPSFNLNDSGQICTLQPSYELQILNPAGNYSYEWHDEEGNQISSAQNITVTKTGKYSVYATSKEGCTSETKTIEIINSGPPELMRNNIKITPTGDTYKIHILDLSQLGNSDYEFALDDPTGQYQKETNFYNVIPGNHRLYVNDKNGCGSASVDLFLFGIPAYFTPNGDGYNDTWNIVGLPDPHGTLILIYDRYGKLLKQLDPGSEGWDGTYNGKTLPADDYWYKVRLEDATLYKGHFSLIRSTR